jgi:hypothetical protein
VFIAVDPQEDPIGFLLTIPESERSCLERAFGSERIIQMLGQEDLLEEDEVELFRRCISEETARRVTLGMMFQEGVSEESLTCMSAKTEGVSFLDLVNFQQQEGIEIEKKMLPILRAMFTCLSGGELTQVGVLGTGEGGRTSEQIKCIFATADDDTLAQLIELGEGGGAGAMPSAQVVELLLECGVFPSSSQ